MATANLTKRVVDSLTFSKGCDYFVWDQKLRGFGVRVREHTDSAGIVNRRKSFVVGYRPHGSRRFRRLVLGVYGPVTVEQARAAALRHLSSVSSGHDPLEAKSAARGERTVRDLGALFLDEVDARKKSATAVEYRRLWKKHVLPALGNKKATQVSLEDARKLHRSLRTTPYVANRVVALLGAFFTFCTREGIPLSLNPVKGVELYPESPRERFLSAQEFRKLGEALTRAERDGLPPAPNYRREPRSAATAKHRPKSADNPIPANPLSVAAIRLLALTGCREGEVLALRWDAVDFAQGYLRLAETKTGKSNRPLSQEAAALIEKLPRVDGNPYVLPGLKPGTHLKEIKRVWYAVRHAAGLDDLRLHDLRHSYASVPASSGESLLVVKSLLGHRRAATTERYAHLADDPVKRAANRASNTIAAWLGKQRAVK